MGLEHQLIHQPSVPLGQSEGAHLCLPTEGRFAAEAQDCADTVAASPLCVSPRLMLAGHRADHHLTALQSVLVCSTAASNTSVSHSSGGKVKALNLVKYREHQ